MAKDRLEALKPVAGDNDDGLPDLISQTNIKVDDEDEDSIDKFFQQVEEVLQLIHTISDNVKKVKSKQGEILADPNTDTKLKQELEDYMSEVKRLSNKVRQNLKLIKQELEESGQTESMASANFRIKQTQCNTLSKKFVDVMNDYNECQVTYRSKCKERIQRQLAITGKATTDEELEEMIESGNPQIFTQGIVMETQAAKKSLADIEARHEDIMKLENSIRELHDMFVDMALLVESQGAMIDRIEYNVSQAVNYVGEAVVNTNTALSYQRSARRCNTLSKKFVDVMNDYNECQVTYRSKCKERIQRQLAITGKATTDEELEEMIESGNPQIFTQGIVMETQAAKKSLADIEARHEDIMKLENSIRELHDMFVDMALLVESQGAMIDRIEYNVSQAVNYVGEAVVNTNKALKYQRSARRKKICIISVVVSIVVVVLICIIVPVVLENTNNKKDNSA